MYLEHFSLKEEPFSLTPNPDYLFLSEGHKEALARVQFGIETRRGFIVLTGEVGSGKTTIIRTYLKQHPPEQKIALVINTKVTAKNLLQNICKDFEIKADYTKLSKDGLLNILYDFILKNSFYGNNLVVIIDEAHDLGARQLEEVRLLTNLETNTSKLLQVVLVGQPELWELLNMPELRSLKQRIQMQYHLKPLDFSDVQRYINHRLACAGSKRKDIFTSTALQKIYRLSGGVPRVVNVICSNALLMAYSKGLNKVDLPLIEEVASEFTPRNNTKIDARPEEPARDSAKQTVEFPVRLKHSRWGLWLAFIVGGFFVFELGIQILALYLGKILKLF